VKWSEYAPALKVYAQHESEAHVEGRNGGWRAVLDRYLGDGPGRLGFFKAASIALGYAARSDEPADEVAGAMHAIIIARPDLTPDREGQYTAPWLSRELMRMRARDEARREQLAREHMDRERAVRA
jgi:hypothetical protein